MVSKLSRAVPKNTDLYTIVFDGNSASNKVIEDTSKSKRSDQQNTGEDESRVGSEVRSKVLSQVQSKLMIVSTVTPTTLTLR